MNTQPSTITVTMPAEVAESLIAALERGLSVTTGPTKWHDGPWRTRISTGLSILRNAEGK